MTIRTPSVRLLTPDDPDGCLGPPPGVTIETREVDGAWRARLVNQTSGVLTCAVRMLVSFASDDPRWLVPGAFYGENRPAACDRLFPRFDALVDDPEHLTSSWWEFRTDRCALPVACGWGAEDGVALEIDPVDPELGMGSLGFGFRDGHAQMWSTFPWREGPVVYVGSERPRPEQLTWYDLAPGASVDVRATVHAIDADRHGYAPLLREIRSRLSASSPVDPWVGVAEGAALAAEGLQRWHFDPDPGVLLETAAFDRALTGGSGAALDRQAMHVGWVSGIPWAYALLRHGRRVGDRTQVGAAAAVIDFICANPAPCGSFWGVWYRESGWRQSWSPVPGALHARTLGEAVTFLVRALALDPGLAAAHPSWVGMARAHLAMMLGRQRPDGNFGATHHAETGEVLSWSGAAGLIWIVACCEAARLPQFAGLPLVASAAAAGDYYARFVTAEFIHGAPEDVDLAPTSEDGYAAIMAYQALHRATGDPRWLDLAARAADWTMTFRYAYNVAFDPHTILAAYHFGTRGADQASSCNQHLHNYGLICHDELIELSRSLGDPWYADRAAETLACFRQFVARADGDFNARRGMVTERFYQTNCFEPKGSMLTLSHAWCVGALLLACEQQLAGQAGSGDA